MSRSGACAESYHFGYEDGTPFYPFGTTIYEWPFQPEERRRQTLDTLKARPFNKARFLAVPPWRESYVEGPGVLDCFSFEGTSKDNRDFSRFNPEYLRRLEACVAQLRDLGIEAGPARGLDPIDQYYETNIAGQPGEYYLIYFGKEPVTQWSFSLPRAELKDGMRFKAETIDTWNMTVTEIDRAFELEALDGYTYVDKGRAAIELPGRPYMALCIRRAR